MSTSHAIFRRPSWEDLELIYRRRELAQLRATLAEREGHLATLRNQINAFEGRYIRQVGVLYVQLDEWHDRLAALKNSDLPKSTRTMEESSRSESAVPSSLPDSSLARVGADTESASDLSLDLKSLFHEVAKRIHPDHARDALDEHHRTQLMAQANAAFLREDATMLHRMLHSHDLPMEALTAAAELAQTRALIRQLHQDLISLDAEFEDLAQSEMADLQRRTAAAAAEGNDILAELAARVKGQIGIAMSRYERELARRKRRQPGFNPAPLLSAQNRQ